MHEIVCVGDVHEGLNFDFRIDPETGISERALDLHGNFAKAAQWAIEHQASLFCVLGDLFDRAHVAPVSRELAYEAARQTWKEWIHNRATDLSAVDVRVLFGHFEFQGVRYASTAPSEVVPNDFTFTPEMVPDAVDLVVFGHIHMHQTIGGKIVYAGAPERIDWGERLDPKGFLALRPEGTWSFIELPARPMDKVEAAVDMGDDVTEKVLAALPPQVGGHLVRIEITLPDELRNRLDEKRLADRLRDAFHYEVKFLSTSRPRVMTEEFTLDPGRLLSDYVDKVLADHPKREAIKVEARRVLKEALA